MGVLCLPGEDQPSLITGAHKHRLPEAQAASSLNPLVCLGFFCFALTTCAKATQESQGQLRLHQACSAFGAHLETRGGGLSLLYIVA